MSRGFPPAEGFLPASGDKNLDSRRDRRHSGAIQGGKLVEQRLRVKKIVMRHTFDLPIDAMQLPIALLVTRDSLLQTMRGMDVDFDGPTNFRHCQVDSDLLPIWKSDFVLWHHWDTTSE